MNAEVAEAIFRKREGMDGKERDERREAFEAWRTHPTTVEVMDGLKALGEKCKERWLSLSWDNGRADPLMLADLRARAEVVDDMVGMTFEELEGINAESERD